MFGFKIVKESEYNDLARIKKVAEDELNTTLEAYKKIDTDCDLLRQQNGNLREENNKLREEITGLKREVKSLREFRRDTLEAMASIDLAGFRLSYCTKKCKNCNDEKRDCKKYEFGRHQYCVIPK